MFALALALSLSAAPGPSRAAHPAPRIELRTAAGHPMKYWLGQPAGLGPGERLPILVVITDARRAFEATASAYVAAQAAHPRFLVVVPATLGSGGTAQNVKQAYPYDDAAWARAAKDGNCAFDDDGLAAVLADVRKTAPADQGRAYLAGLEAAGHVIFAQAFRHPERWRAVIAVAPNWAGRCMDDAAWSADSSRVRLPILVLHGERDSLWAASPLPGQAAQAEAAARAHGFRGVEDRAIPAQGHEFPPGVVLSLLPGANLR
jgi:poly(3-hydroxybutyrate) depolymerase